MGSRKELLINDYGTYYANIHSSNTLMLSKTKLVPESDSKKLFSTTVRLPRVIIRVPIRRYPAATAGHVYSDTVRGDLYVGNFSGAFDNKFEYDVYMDPGEYRF